MKKTALVMLAVASTPPAATVASDVGSLCIAPVPYATDGDKSQANSTASAQPYDFTVAIGGKEPIAVSHELSILVSALAPETDQWVVIKQGGKSIASFKLRISKRSSGPACLWFNPLYETWSVWSAANSRGKCSCV